MSTGLIGHDFPPKDMDMETWLLQAERRQQTKLSVDEKEVERGTTTYGM